MAANEYYEIIPVLENRVLRISATLPGLEFRYYTCTKKFLGWCREWTPSLDTYDLTVAATRDTLRAKNFVCRAREKVTP